jgi:hypothetical protein
MGKEEKAEVEHDVEIRGKFESPKGKPCRWSQGE